MFQKILVAMDNSDTNRDIFDRALTLAKSTDARLMLLHVLSSDDEGSPGMPLYPHLSFYPSVDDAVWENYRVQWEAIEKQGIERLQAYTKEAMTLGVKTEFTQTPGSPGRVICNLARTWEADLIITGSRGRTGLSEMFLGSVSNYVTHHAPCSVLIIHASKQPANGESQNQQEELASV
ncbi:MAG: universal stress protein [Cyanothece sp. SIO1E1]|nr:universal stress protein [Cyanothece sp. SIO1E1]